nr:conserved hypothetical protein [Albugo laibachii Nc14]|eukprot:CCA26511.1 conserved hypothetical protein [Albugo laibachii Nc14]
MGHSNGLGIFKSVKRVEIKAETTTPGELLTTTDANGARVNATRTRRTLPKVDFLVEENGAIVRGPQRNYELSRSLYLIPPYASNFDEEIIKHEDFISSADMEHPNGSDDSDIHAHAIMNGEESRKSFADLTASPYVQETQQMNEEKALVQECVLDDTRASSLDVCYDDTVGKFVCGASVERFSGHTGVCKVLGSKRYAPVQHQLRLGDLIRIGSVGLVVTELNRTEQDENTESLTPHDLEILKARFLSVPLQQTFNTGLSMEQVKEESDSGRSSEECDFNEGDREDQKQENERNRLEDRDNDEIEECDELKLHPGNGETSDEGDFDDAVRGESIGIEDNLAACKQICDQNSRRGSAQPPNDIFKVKRFCYICYDEDADIQNNPLVAPCACRGDTKYLHLKCLKRWNHNLNEEGHDPNPQRRMCVVTNLDGLHLCTICKTPYALSTRLEDGRVISLLPDKLMPPFVTFAVVTPHEARSRVNVLTNTRFQLSFAGLPSNQQELTIGRSTSNHMMVRYRTVSQLHAKVNFKQNEFYLNDASSSNGTMLFLSRPMELEWNEPTHVKIGRTILTMRAKKKLKWTDANFGESTYTQSAAVSPCPVLDASSEKENRQSSGSHQATRSSLRIGGDVEESFLLSQTPMEDILLKSSSDVPFREVCEQQEAREVIRDDLDGGVDAFNQNSGTQSYLDGLDHAFDSIPYASETTARYFPRSLEDQEYAFSSILSPQVSWNEASSSYVPHQTSDFSYSSSRIDPSRLDTAPRAMQSDDPNASFDQEWNHCTTLDHNEAFIATELVESMSRLSTDAHSTSESSHRDCMAWSYSATHPRLSPSSLEAPSFAQRAHNLSSGRSSH